jgi:hypothetical protein
MLRLNNRAQCTQVGVDYAPLRVLLKEGKWREAEDETRAKLIEASGKDLGPVLLLAHASHCDRRTVSLVWSSE